MYCVGIYFIFNNKIYKHISGVLMKFPLSPTYNSRHAIAGFRGKALSSLNLELSYYYRSSNMDDIVLADIV